MQINSESSYKNIWTKKIANVENNRRSRDVDFKTLRIYRSKFKRYMMLIWVVKKFNKLAMRIFMSQKTRFLKLYSFQWTFITKAKQSNHNIYILKVYTSFQSNSHQSRNHTLSMKKRDLSENLSETWARIWTRFERELDRKFKFTL